MANTNTPWGLAPSRYFNGTPWNGGGNTYYIASSDTNAYAIGDPVTLVSGGADANGIPGVTLATAGFGNLVTGVVLGMGGPTYGGFFGDPTNLNTTIVPATKTKAYYILVCDDPNVLFTIQEGGSGSALTVASVGKNFDLKSGTNSGYLSGWTLDNGTSNTGSTRQLKIFSLDQTVGNAVGQYAKWLVFINNHSYRTGLVGV